MLTLVITDAQVAEHDTLIWNKDGFCWLRLKDGTSPWEGQHASVPAAEKACREAGHNPTARYSVPDEPGSSSRGRPLVRA